VLSGEADSLTLPLNADEADNRFTDIIV
jgi:hypothetical protein